MTKNDLEECIRHTNMVIYRWKQNPRSKIFQTEVEAVLKGLLNKHIGYNRRNVFKQVAKNLIISTNSNDYISNIKVIFISTSNTLADDRLRYIDEYIKDINFKDLEPNETNIDTLSEVSEIKKELNFQSIINIKF